MKLRRPIMNAPAMLLALAAAAALAPYAGAAARPDPSARDVAGRTATRSSPAAATRCFSPQGETISAQKVMKDLADGKDVDIQGRIIEGSLDAESLWPAQGDERKTSLRVMRGRLRCTSCRITGRISFPRTVMLGDLDLSCSEVLGDVDLTDADIRGRIYAENTRFVGEVRLNRTTVFGDTILRSTTIEDRLEITGARLGLLALGDGDFKHDVDMTRTVTDVLVTTGARVGGAMRLQDVLVLRALTAGSTTFGRGFTAESVRVCGSLDLSGDAGAGEGLQGDDAVTADGEPTVPGSFSLSDVDVEGQLLLSLAANSSVSLDDVKVKQSLVMLDGNFGEVAMNDVTVKGETRFDGARFANKVMIAGTDFGRDFSASETLFLGEVELRRVRFPGDDPLDGAVFSKTPTVVDTDLPKPPNVVSDQPDQDDDATGEPPGDEPPGDEPPEPPD